MFTLKCVGTTLDTEAEAIEAFRALEAKGRNYGNVYVKRPDGSTINVWDI